MGSICPCSQFRFGSPAQHPFTTRGMAGKHRRQSLLGQGPLTSGCLMYRANRNDGTRKPGLTDKKGRDCEGFRVPWRFWQFCWEFTFPFVTLRASRSVKGIPPPAEQPLVTLLVLLGTQVLDEIQSFSSTQLAESKLAEYNEEITKLLETLMALEMQLVDQLEVRSGLPRKGPLWRTFPG